MTFSRLPLFSAVSILHPVKSIDYLSQAGLFSPGSASIEACRHLFGEEIQDASNVVAYLRESSSAYRSATGRTCRSRWSGYWPRLKLWLARNRPLLQSCKGYLVDRKDCTQLKYDCKLRTSFVFGQLGYRSCLSFVGSFIFHSRTFQAIAPTACGKTFSTVSCSARRP